MNIGLKFKYNFLLVAVLVTLSYKAYAAESMCESFGKAFMRIVVEKKQPHTFSLIAYTGHALAIHLNHRTGEWTLVGHTDDAKKVCEIMTGDSFSMMRFRSASH